MIYFFILYIPINDIDYTICHNPVFSHDYIKFTYYKCNHAYETIDSTNSFKDNIIAHINLLNSTVQCHSSWAIPNYHHFAS